MSTEKSTITWEQVVSKIDKVNHNSTDTFWMPFGVDDDGDIAALPLRNTRFGHVFLLGRTGSGKSVMVSFIIAALMRLYKDKVKITYVDGKGIEVQQWKTLSGTSRLGASTGSLYGEKQLHSHLELGEIIDGLCTEVGALKEPKVHRFIIFDNVEHFMNERNYTKLALLTDACEGKCSHVLYAASSLSDLAYRLIAGRKEVLVLRTSLESSQKLLDSDIAAVDQSRYGTVYLRELQTGNCTKYNTVYISDREIKGKCWEYDAQPEVINHFVTESYRTNMNLTQAKCLLKKYKGYMELLTTAMVSSSTYMIRDGVEQEHTKFDFNTYSLAQLELIDFIHEVENAIDEALRSYPVPGIHKDYRSVETEVKMYKKMAAGVLQMVRSKDDYVVYSNESDGTSLIRKNDYSMTTAQYMYETISDEISMREVAMKKFAEKTIIEVPIINISLGGGRRIV